ncbi:hypothetical protein SAM23877_2285 [Streptomyces ambofaciens ATCC 23877]|uniref:Uncharacterized protein n=1 Tax=Streptomyces ambofaciens (strain ATCC 23877 / 3486 / DSM 40053 / JCM 4204 / NBRC 12836 / NRRL B-2516) TaxID=278992 RepID=A0A0K2AQS1_STRA7|nr:hypothetical protein SAM23877_2285 [Streptomyces ambofaciens ATCC 23877]
MPAVPPTPRARGGAGRAPWCRVPFGSDRTSVCVPFPTARASRPDRMAAARRSYGARMRPPCDRALPPCDSPRPS